MKNSIPAFILCAGAVLTTASADVVLIRNGSVFQTFSGDTTTGPGFDHTNNIHEALALAIDGDTVEIRDSMTYSINRNDRYHITAANLTLRGADGFRPILSYDGTGTNTMVQAHDSADGLTIENISFHQNQLHGNHAIQLNGSGGTADNVTIHNTEWINFRSVVSTNDSDNFTFTDNLVSNSRYSFADGLNWLGEGTHTFSGNTFDRLGEGTGANMIEFGNLGATGHIIFDSNTFTNYDSRYAIFSDTLTPDQFTFLNNIFDQAQGGNGAIFDLFSQSGGGFSVGIVPAPGSFALLGLGGIVATRRKR